MFFRVLTEPVTPARINFSEINTKIPAAKAPAIGNPTSPTSAKKSIIRSYSLCMYLTKLVFLKKRLNKSISF
jgi:hypothetical protein